MASSGKVRIWFGNRLRAQAFTGLGAVVWPERALSDVAWAAPETHDNARAAGQAKEVQLFDIGDKIVHVHHGPGKIAAIEQCELMNEPQECYILQMPMGLTVYVPVARAREAGMRLAMSPSRIAGVLRTLGSRPRLMCEDFKMRQSKIAIRFKSRRSMEIARLVRDLTWRQESAHLTQRDRDLLRQGQDMLAAEISLVSGQPVSQASALIRSTLLAAVAGAAH